jgi:hypothetical protein
MPALTKATTGQILSGRESWKLTNGFEVIASESDGACVLFVSGKKNGKNVELVSTYLEVKGVNHILGATIDSHCMEIPIDKKLEKIEV